MSGEKPDMPRSDLPTRFVAGIVMIAVAVAATYFGGWWFRALAAAAAAIMLAEWAAIHRIPALQGWASGALLAALLLAAGEYLLPAGGGDWLVDEISGEALGYFDPETLAPAWLGFGAITLLTLAVGLTTRRPAMAWGTIYVGVPAFALIALSWVWGMLVFWVFVVTWATDILAYFAGRILGGPKLAPRISPNKTWSGLIGGVFGAALFGALMAWQFDMGTLFLWAGGPMAVVAQAGDLYESSVKRRVGVKDSGAILPGHGGVLDRLDGLLAVSFAVTLMLLAGLWSA